MDESTDNLTPEQAAELGLEPATEQAEANQETFTVLPYVEETRDPSKTGNKPKQLVAVEVYGYEVGRGRRKRVVTPEDVYKLAAIGSNDREIAQWFDINEDTLRYNFADIIAKGREDLRHSLRRAQIKVALSGNPTMLIWLGRNLLGQSDNPYNTAENDPLPWTDD
jgi:hypothetical protein